MFTFSAQCNGKILKYVHARCMCNCRHCYALLLLINNHINCTHTDVEYDSVQHRHIIFAAELL